MTFRFIWKLVFQGGLLSGQELHLPDGELTLGAGHQWDIDLLRLDNYQDKHCILRVSQEGVFLLPLDMPCKINNRRVKTKTPQEQIALQPGQTVKVGSCAFTLARAGENVGFTTQHNPRQNWLQVLGVALPGGLAAAILVTLLYASQELRASVPRPTQEPFNIEQYQQALKETGLANIRVERDPSGALTLFGSCWETAKLEPFLNQLVEAGVAYRNQVMCQDDLQRSVGYVLRANGYQNAQVTAGPTLGSIAISGNMRADEQWTHVSRQLNNLPGLKAWSVTNNAEQTIDSLVLALREKNLLAHLSIVKQDDVLTVTGQLQNEQRQSLQQILDSYQQQQHLRIVYQDIPASEQEAGIFPAPIASYSGNASSASLQLANGVRIQTGSTLPSGYTITGLDATGVELQKEGQLVHLPLGL